MLKLLAFFFNLVAPLLILNSWALADTQIPSPICNEGMSCVGGYSKCTADGLYVESQGYSAHAKYTLVTEMVCIASNGTAVRYSKNQLLNVLAYGWENDAANSKATAIKKCEAEIQEFVASYGLCNRSER